MGPAIKATALTTKASSQLRTPSAPKMLTTIRGATLAIQTNSPPTIRAKPHPRSLGATLRGERARAKSSQSGGTHKCTRPPRERQARATLGIRYFPHARSERDEGIALCGRRGVTAFAAKDQAVDHQIVHYGDHARTDDGGDQDGQS